jgi:hypothetical protein
VHAGAWWGGVRERQHLDDPGVDGKMTLNWIFRKCDREACVGLIW